MPGSNLVKWLRVIFPAEQNTEDRTMSENEYISSAQRERAAAFLKCTERRECL